MWCLLSILYLLSAQSPSKSLGNLEDPMPITLVLSPAHSVYYSTSMKWTSGRIASALTMLLNWWNNKLISWQCSSLIKYKNKATSLDISQTTCCMRELNSASCHSTKTWFFYPACGEIGSNIDVDKSGHRPSLCPLALCVMLRCQEALPVYLCWGPI